MLEPARPLQTAPMTVMRDPPHRLAVALAAGSGGKGAHVGLNWSGMSANGYDIGPGAVKQSLAARETPAHRCYRAGVRCQWRALVRWRVTPRPAACVGRYCAGWTQVRPPWYGPRAPG